jgi:hypothetical protein
VNFVNGKFVLARWAMRLVLPLALMFAGSAAAQTATPGSTLLSFNPASVGVAAASAQTLSASFTITGAIGTFTPVAQLHYGKSYTLGAVSCTGGSTETCTVPVTFSPIYPGARRDAIFLMKGSTRMTTMLLNGIGQAPLALMQPGVITQPIAAGPTYYYNSIVDENGIDYVISETSSAIYSVTSAGVVTALPISGLSSPRAIAIDGAGVLFIADQKPNSAITTYDTVQGIQGSLAYPTGVAYIQALALGDVGNLFETDSVNIYKQSEYGGAITTVPINPTFIQPSVLLVDSNENAFIGGYAENELQPNGTQTRINQFNAQNGYVVDAADTLYIGRFSNNSSTNPINQSVGMVPASNVWTAPIGGGLDYQSSPLGLGLAGDGAVWVGNYTNLDRVDRSQGTLSLNANNPGQTAAPQTAYLYNGGNQPLILTSFALTGDTTDFSLTSPSTGACTAGMSIPVGAICGVTVNFTAPSHGDLYTATLSFTTNSLNASTTQQVALSDGVTGSYITGGPTTLNFGSQALNTTSAPMNVTFTNSGYNSVGAAAGYSVSNYDFSVLSLPSACYHIPVGGTCTAQITFTPNAPGPASGTIAFGENTGNIVINVSGSSPTPGPAVSLSPNPVTFASRPQGTPSASQAVTLTNTGSATLTLSSIAITGANSTSFAQTNTCGSTVAAGNSCTINVTFTPAASGPLSAFLTVTDNASDSPESVPLSGTGVALPTVPQLQFVPAAMSLFAGAGPGCSDTGDGGPALAATLCQVPSAAVDQAGNTYIVDQQYNTIRKVDIHGNISTFAGIPRNAGFNFSSGDGGLATAAYLDVPSDVAVDPSGNVYIAESYASKIREVNATTGIITTFVGGASGNFRGGTGTSVALGEPIGIAFDPSGNLYIGTFGQYLVIKVNAAGVATAFAGTGTQGYNGDNIQATTAELTDPLFVASDLAGNIYIEDGSPSSPGTGNCRFRKVTAATGVITTVAGNGTCGATGDGGSALSAEINTSYGPFAVDLAGDILFNTASSSSAGSVVRKVDTYGNINTIVGGGTGQPAASTFPATGPYFPGLNAARLDNNGNLLMPIAVGGTSNYADQVFAAGPGGFLQFASQPVNTTSAALTVTLENTGSAPLSLSQTTYTATGDFAVTGGTCVGLTSLSSGTTCALTVTFTPSAPGARTGSIAVGSNAIGGATSSITLQGTGTSVSAPGASLAPAPLSFPNTAVGTSASLNTTLTNTGNASMSITGITLAGANASAFAETSSCGSTLAAGISCAISVTFTPAAAGANSATLSVSDNVTGSPQIVMLTGTGTAPQANLAPNPVAFGNQSINTTSATQTVMLSNPGNATLSITGVTLTGANAAAFTQTSACGSSLAAGGSCAITVAFAPTAAGAQSATLSVADNATGTPQTVTLTGTGTAPQASLAPTPVSFGNQIINTTSATQTVALSNAGNAPLTITGITVSGVNAAAFSETTTCGATLAAGTSCNIVLAFTPAATGAESATLTVTSNASGGTQTASLTGAGVPVPAPIASLAPATLTFGSTIVGSSAPAQALTLSNTGNAALPIASIAIGGANASSFTQTNTCGASLAAGASCTLTVAFSPAAAGSFSATLSVTDSAAGSPQGASLTGTAYVSSDFTLSPSPASVTVNGGTTASFTLTVGAANGTVNGAVALTASALPGAIITFSPASVSPGSASATSTMTVQTTTALAEVQRPRSGTLGGVFLALTLPLFAARRRMRDRIRRHAAALTLLLLLGVAATTLTGCGGGFTLPSRTYAITVTAVSSTNTHTATVTLTVQ